MLTAAQRQALQRSVAARTAASTTSVPTPTAAVDASVPQAEVVKPVFDERYLQDADQKIRFKDAGWFGDIKQLSATIVGLGGIGSWLALCLARTGIGQILGYDHDFVSDTNMAGQMYKMADIGYAKTECVWRTIREFVPTVAGAFFQERYTDQRLAQITCTALDSMAARKVVFEQWKKQFISGKSKEEKQKAVFVDGRMAAEAFQVFCFRGDQDSRIKNYEKECLFTDDQASATTCSYKATTFVGMNIASIMTAIVKEHIHFKDNDIFDKLCPFYYEFDANFGIAIKTAKTWKYQKTQ